jgi:predicted translin family RNA/ssDNA-binding protein
MRDETKTSWDYVDEVSRESQKYVGEAEKALSSRNYGEAARYYNKASDAINKLKDIVEGFPRGARTTANVLSTKRIEYLKKAEELRKKSRKRVKE